MSDDEFMDIINHNDMGNLQAESELFNLSLKDLVGGLRSLSECIMIISDFIDTYVEDDDEDEDEDTTPVMPIEAVMHAKQLFETADRFTYAILSEEYIDDDDDDDDFDEDDEEDDDD